jgi:hypothetical protein
MTCSDLRSIRTDGKIPWCHTPDVEVPVLNPLRQDPSAHRSQPFRASHPSETHRPQQELDLQHEVVSQVSRRPHAAPVAASLLTRGGYMFAFILLRGVIEERKQVCHRRQL